MNLIRFGFFLVLLGLVATGALVYFDLSDAQVRRAVHAGSGQLQKDVEGAGKVAAEVLGDAVQRFNEEAKPLRAEAQQLRRRADETVQNETESLEERREQTAEKLDGLGDTAKDWSENLKTELRGYAEAARQRIDDWKKQLDSETAEE